MTNGATAGAAAAAIAEAPAGSAAVDSTPLGGSAAIRLTWGPWWNKRQRPLSDITAVQLIPGKHREGEWEWPGFRPYELNLVFQEGKRLNVSNHADLSWTRRTAVRLAGFLDVPLIESERAITSNPGWTRVRR